MNNTDKRLDVIHGLPEKVAVPRKRNIEFYGAIHNVAEYCGLRKVVLPKDDRIIWQHGWHHSSKNIDPRLVIGHQDHFPDRLQLVARKDQEDYLRSQGFERTLAVGLPICYLPDLPTCRLDNSLLVMPAHSLSYTTHSWGFQEYAEYIKGISGDFEHVLVSISPSCLENGYWIEEFRSLGVAMVLGADSKDRNALKRMQRLFQRFEYVTTNKMGSHIPYAAAFGAKVSIAGPFAESKEADFSESKYYQTYPDLLRMNLDWNSLANIRGLFDFLFVEPHEAVDRTEWGRAEIGFASRLTPERCKEVFDLGVITQVKMALENSLDNFRQRVSAKSSSLTRRLTRSNN